MPVSFATFERLKARGVAAYKGRDYAAAKTYLVEAAECVIELAESAKSDAARRQHEQIAAELIDLARDCDRLKNAPKGARPRIKERDAENGGADASDWIVRDKPNIGFDDIAGLEDVKTDIRLKMIYPLQKPELAARYGINLGGGVLLYGPPGTGKTMMAKAIAHEIDAVFFMISPAQVLSKWVGEAEQNIRKLFDAAKAEAKSIIFIDEVEALIPKRQTDASSVMQRVVPQILQELEGFDRKPDRALLFMGATNKPWMLDEALLRPGRLDTKVYIGLPDAPARYKLLEMYLAKRPVAPDVDFGALCDRLEGYSGADIKSLADRAASIPFMESIAGKEPRPISMADLTTIMAATPPSVSPADLVRYQSFEDSGR
ncbi:MAG TPA: ATP-binding protein [Phycisphaerae bacterium]